MVRGRVNRENLISNLKFQMKGKCCHRTAPAAKGTQTTEKN